MGEDTDTRKINHSFLRDHSYVTEADIISTVEFNHTGELLATGDKGGRVVIFQREPEVRRDLVVAGGGSHPTQAFACSVLDPRNAFRTGRATCCPGLSLQLLPSTWVSRYRPGQRWGDRRTEFSAAVGLP
uniref:Protein phosphatase 2 regulatory subunit Balpha n=1 Tax=Canis lupus dingo TaxID=286419 RepID=A0A8C0KPK4_CANLU